MDRRTCYSDTGISRYYLFKVLVCENDMINEEEKHFLNLSLQTGQKRDYNSYGPADLLFGYGKFKVNDVNKSLMLLKHQYEVIT